MMQLLEVAVSLVDKILEIVGLQQRGICGELLNPTGLAEQCFFYAS